MKFFFILSLLVVSNCFPIQLLPARSLLDRRPLPELSLPEVRLPSGIRDITVPFSFGSTPTKVYFGIRPTSGYAFILNGVVMEKPVVIDPDSISSLSIGGDTLIVVNDVEFNRYFSLDYRDGNATLIPFNQVSNEINSTKYNEHFHIYLLNNRFSKNNPQNVLIDKDIIYKVNLMEFEIPSETRPLKILVVQIFTKRYKRQPVCI